MKKPPKRRAEFSKPVKRALAERNAYKCSWPGCKASTIGPGHKNELQSVLTGQAAHIYSAAANGPRANPTLTREQKSSISNGIWMCNYHAGIIDADECQYTAETLQRWKSDAIHRAHKDQVSLNGKISDTSTLIGVANIVFAGAWLSITENIWVFEAQGFILGTLEDLFALAGDFSNSPSKDKYVVVESQGDGRSLASITVAIQDGKTVVTCGTLAKHPRKDIADLGSDIAIGEDFDIYMEDGDLHEISGIELALQELRLQLSANYGDYLKFPEVGSLFSMIYKKHRDNPTLLNRLAKMEVIRLLAVPSLHKGGITAPPLLDFINQVHEVRFENLDVQNGPIPVFIKLQWANMESWQGELIIYIRN